MEHVCGRRWLVLAFVGALTLLASLSARAGPTVNARFDVNPIDAQVWLDGRFVGPAHEVLKLDAARLDGAPLEVRFVLDGFQTRTATIPADYFRTHNVYPESGEVVLPADSIWSALRHRVGTLGLMVIPLLGGVVGALFLGGLSLHLFRATRSQGPDGLPGQLGDFRVVERIGSGTCATVYRGESVRERRAVAIKVIRAELSAHPEYRARFEREIVLYRRLSHPAIVGILDWGSVRDQLYVVTEFAGGGTLDRAYAERRPALDEALALLGDIFSATHYAHTEGVVHRDLKPQNILLIEETPVRAQVADFGLAASAAFSAITMTGRMLGTPAYIAPELIRPADQPSEKMDARCDQYSLGVLAYELLSGERPFAMDTVEQALWGHLHEAPVPITSVRPDLPVALDAVLVRMLAKRPEERFDTVRDALDALVAAARPHDVASEERSCR